MGELFKGGDYFKYFRLKGTINRDTCSYYSREHYIHDHHHFLFPKWNTRQEIILIQDNDLGFSPIQSACKDGRIILCWLKVVSLQDLFSVRLNFSKCWFLAGSSHQIIVSHPAPVNVNRSNVIWDVSRSAEIHLPFPCKAGLFSFSCAQRPPRRCLRTPETRKQLSRLQTQWTSLALVE